MHGGSSSWLLLVNALCGALSLFTNPPMCYLLHARVFELLLICYAYKKFNAIAYCCFCRVTLDLSSLLLRWYLLSGNLLMCCKPFSANLSIILKELLGFSSSMFGGFPLGISCLSWLFDYMADLWRWFIWLIYEAYLCGWYIYEIYMWLIYSYVADLWDTYVLKSIDKSFKVQVSLIFLKHLQWMEWKSTVNFEAIQTSSDGGSLSLKRDVSATLICKI